MNNIFRLSIPIIGVAILSGCSSLTGGLTSDDLNTSNIALADNAKVVAGKDSAPIITQVPDDIPPWYINFPKDTNTLIYGSGSGLSNDLQFSMDKALHQAKIILGDKISTDVSAEIKTYMADNSAIGNGVTVEETQRVSKSGFKNVDVSAYEVKNKHIYQEQNKFRSFILLELDITDVEDRKSKLAAPQPKVDIKTIQKAQEEARKSLDDL